MILLDTNAVIWLEQEHPRTRRLARNAARLFLSPATLLELQFLSEAGRIRLSGLAARAVAENDRWTLDEPASGEWFLQAVDVGWTRDPFDRLLVAHARVRGWRIATADLLMLQHLGPSGSLEL